MILIRFIREKMFYILENLLYQEISLPASLLRLSSYQADPRDAD